MEIQMDWQWQERLIVVTASWQEREGGRGRELNSVNYQVHNFNFHSIDRNRIAISHSRVVPDALYILILILVNFDHFR